MLKVCWDCIVGGGGDNETTYNSRLNGNNSYTTQWTSFNMEKVFRLPKYMNGSDGIHIEAKLTGNESLFFTLYRHNQNVATKIEMNFLDKCTYEHSEDGNKQIVSDTPPSDLITGSDFTLSIDVLERDDDAPMLKISIGVSYLCAIFVNDISSITSFNFSNNVHVRQLTFRYA